MTKQELAIWIREVNQANGFDAPTWDTIPTKLMLVVTELNEAREAAIGSGEDPLPEELADTAIRLFDILGAVWPDCWAFRYSEPARYVPLFRPIEQMLWAPLAHLCNAVEAWRHENQVDTRIAIELALREVYCFATALTCDLDREITHKVLKNKQRGHLHGKKRADG